MMKRIGLILISAAFLAGAYLSVLDAVEVDWVPFAAVLFTGFLGVWILRRAEGADATATERIASDTQTMQQSLENVVKEVSALVAGIPDMDVYALPAAIDANVVPHLNVFVASRDTLKHAFGLQAFADIMTSYAGGERYLNRVWSCSADGYIDEAAAYLPRSLEQFTQAKTLLDGFSDSAE
ncbi:MAG: hypothetical protein HKN29_06790 [Rhodothermales bacterium]|nr:hypothetical protein [Rhodothermales bacterium]